MKPEKRNTKVIIQTLVKITKILIAVGLVIWLIKNDRLEFSILFSTPLNIFYLLGFIAIFLNMLLQALRWWWLLRIQNIDLSLKQAIQLSWIGQFFSIVLPGASGGEMVRAYYIAQNVPEAKVAGVTSVFLDRAMGLYSLITLGIFVIIILIISKAEMSFAMLRVGLIIAVLFTCMSGLFLVLWAQPSRNLIFRFLPDRFSITLDVIVKTYGTYRKDFFISFCISILANIILMGAFMFITQSIGSPVSWHQIFLVVPLIIIANTLPISPGGIGVAETTASVLFAEFGVETGAVIMLILRLWILILRLPGGLVYVLATRNKSS